jgi:hypothetical protein
MLLHLVELLAAFVMIVVVGAAFLSFPMPTLAQTPDGDDPLRPKRHFKIQRPANLTHAEAMAFYDTIAAEMAHGYAVSRDATARRFQKWRRFNGAPYKSATHGNRYVNNFADPVAAET